MISGRYSSFRSGGAITRRAAMPSSAISASAAPSWLWVRTRTWAPSSEAGSAARPWPPARSPRRTEASAASNSARPLPNPARRLGGGSVFIEFHELAQRHGEIDILRRGEGIDAQFVLQLGH